MSGRYVETEYAYSSARIRFHENSLATKEYFERMLDAHAADEVMNIVFDTGIGEKCDKVEENDVIAPSEKREQVLQNSLREAYSLIQEISPLHGLTGFLQYQYDCNNIKMAIKCRIRGIEPDKMLYDIGTVSVDKIKKMAAEQKFGELPENMAVAAERAVVDYSKNKNPQSIDMLIDKACFADMLAAAKETRVPYIEKLVKAKIDIVNFLITVRVLRMKGNENNESSIFQGSLIEGGKISVNSWKRAYEGGEDMAVMVLKNSEYSFLGHDIETAGTNDLASYERICDNYWLELAKSAKFISFGAPVLIGYVVAMEYQIKNIRIILAGKAAGLSTDVIRERMRASYV